MHNNPKANLYRPTLIPLFKPARVQTSSVISLVLKKPSLNTRFKNDFLDFSLMLGSLG